MEAVDAANPISNDTTGELRAFRGFFGNLAYDYHGSAIAVGGGTTFVRPTALDIDPARISSLSILKQQTEYHVVLSQRVDALIFTAEYMHWKSEWHYGETQNLNFGGVGANFTW